MRFYFLLLFSYSFGAFAHQSALTSSGSKASWPSLSIPLTIQANSADFSSTSQRNIIIAAIAEWNSASRAQINNVSNSVNTISFTSDFSEYGSGVVGVTEVSYNSAGTIQRANIILNDNYRFKDTPGFYGSGEVYLGDVVTHEMGHFLGLSHSEVLDASMIYSSFSGQSTLSLDDKAGVRHKYDSGYGSISGYVKGGSNIGVLAAHVQAISRNSGEVISAFSDENGRFIIGGLDLNDTYYLYTSPMKNQSSMPSYYANAQNAFCPGSYVGSFFNACGKAAEGFPQPINLTTSQPNKEVGVVTINCSLKANEDYNYEKLQPNFLPVTIYDYADDQRLEKAFVGHFRTSSLSNWTAWDKLSVDLGHYDSSAGNRYLKIALSGRKLGNQLEYELEIWKNGSKIAADIKVRQDGVLTSITPGVLTRSPLTETYEADLETLIPLSIVPGDNVFEVRVRARRLSAFYVLQTFPDFEAFSSSRSLPYLLVTSIMRFSSGLYSPLMDTQSNLSDNASCLDAPYTYKVARSSSASENGENSQKAAAASAGCGTIEPPDSGNNNGQHMMLLSLGFLLSLLAASALKRSKNFLS